MIQIRLGQFAAVLAISAAAAPPAGTDEAPPRLAKPPVWTAEALDAFFEDAREHLVGERPANRPKAVDDGAAAASGSDSAPEGELAWSKLSDGETLVDEVKRIANGLSAPLATAAKFKAGGYQQCRADFSMLAVLLGVIAEYDGDIRWKNDAPALRDRIARAAQNCKVGADQTYQEALQRKVELDDLVRGERLAGDGAALEAWSALADRALLMQRMETMIELQISPRLDDKRAFARGAVDVKHDAQLLAILADVIQREKYDYWDDEPFQEQADELRAAAVALSGAAGEENFDAARAALQRVEQACANCHAGYRG